MNDLNHLPDGMNNFSVLIAVYQKDKSEYLDLSLSSIINQSIPPTEIILVKDGPIPTDLDRIIEQWRSRFNGEFKIISLDTNRGLGEALGIGLNACTNEIVARMDADDICELNRFEIQMDYLRKNSEIDVLSSCVAEFDFDHTKIGRYRKVPLSPGKIKVMAKFRNPINHMSVIFKKSSVISAGNYHHCLWFEDYYLWARMMIKGYRFANLSEPLVRVRANSGMFRRRGGIKYFQQEIRVQREFLKMGFISWPIYLFNCIFRGIVRLIPNNIRSLAYRALLR